MKQAKMRALVNGWLRRTYTVIPIALFALIAGDAAAQAYPNKPIRIIVPGSAGGGSDQVARIVAQYLASAVGQQVIVDNRGGGGGTIGTELAAKASPDGYTLVLPTLSHATNSSLYRKPSFDPIKDFASITQVTAQHYILVVHPSVPAKTVKEFIAVAKSKQGGITYASSGSGEAGHIGMELLKTLAGFDAVHVPYKGTAPSMVDTLSGQVDVTLVSTPGGLPHVKAGRLRALAVSSLKRSALLPDVPTVAETGFPGYEVNGWKGLLAPAGTPR
ncbi:MAG: tripartite tricarboxylate transporter substrate binding protein, partial [Betaproteobacteria bacterium]|nr:tripartite tricarboxylate transporter substrate binding protein [Betaproteobacteria bacterium]